MELVACETLSNNFTTAIVSYDGVRYHFLFIGTTEMTILDDDRNTCSPEEVEAPLALLRSVLGDDATPGITKYFREKK